MSSGHLETYSCILEEPRPTWEELTQIRDQFLGQLIF